MTYQNISIRMQWALAKQAVRLRYKRAPLLVEQWVWNAANILAEPCNDWLQIPWVKRDGLLHFMRERKRTGTWHCYRARLP